MITETANGSLLPRIIGVGAAESRGLRRGFIVNVAEVAKSVKHAINQAEKTAGLQIKKASLSVGGIGVNAFTQIGAAAISRADLEITDLDINKAVEESQNAITESSLLNRKIIHSIPISFKIDGKLVWGQPAGMKGAKLEAKTFFVTCLEQHLDNLTEAVELTGVKTENLTASPFPTSLVNLTRTQKIAGVALANIGAETTAIAIIENDLPVSLEVLPFGSADITNDIALGLKISLEEAENLKIGNAPLANFSRRKLDEIIEARLSDIFELINNHLKKANRGGLLPAGIVITGGGAGTINIEQSARTNLNLPARALTSLLGANSKIQVKENIWSIVYGLCLIGKDGVGADNFGYSFVQKDALNKIKNWFKQFMP
ncbi:MAG: cell division protein FtsA [Candidatus Taylorbacteria bacterium RIFCSPHIGHO2_02_FULL_44_36]|uniref:Cell division protein FtsA n=1 Tax=Candidatus Taylorbacteria bacterium RIFCSPLOWO2_12_FULL_44_15c TaxID=1802333 RepID=A0A1G2P3P2_9BACT|nr:MAG: cell division protein FtsA [Candidatus Taylorbacteria bacterium RIFCSPHIGHO2_02_FULL_44_36]OHA39631.1 MAG: cell division protein FtsA [Candidatus Taylorbacteria bacterium RIFCSPLOWO2_02_FULL_44_35]OHA42956.1 MAG: cell division protein FtsA [Candidatus Taylorbacteria bacterium RIFCSPLOWO2_12_FULL_44_15c]